MKRRRNKGHRNPNGNWCYCPWGGGNTDPYHTPQNREAYGSVTHESMWHEASKLEWLRDRPDMQDHDSRRFLTHLEQHFPKHDPLFPWMVKQWKKGNLLQQEYYPGGQYQDTYPTSYMTDTGQREGLDEDDMRMLGDYMKYKKQNKAGIDIMQHDIGHILPEASKWESGGDLIYDSNEDDTAPHAGYHLYHLRTKRDLRVEGRRMNHCIGSNGQSYDGKRENGTGLYYSIRDDDNVPHGTVEFGRSQSHYFKCPSCNKFTPGVPDYSKRGHDGTIMTCDNCGHDLGERDLHGGITPYTTDGVHPRDHKMDKTLDEVPDPGEDIPFPAEQSEPPPDVDLAQTFPVDLSKMAKKPDPRFMSARQFHGWGDKNIPREAYEALNHFFQSHHDHPEIYASEGVGHNWRGEYDEDEDEDEDNEPQDLTDLGYSESYTGEGPTNIDQLRRWDDGEHDEFAPQEWHDAVRATHDHDHIYPPELEIEPPDWHDIFQNLTQEHVDPHDWDDLFRIASEQGEQEQVMDAARQWIDNEYTPWLDPYGQEGGVGHMPPTGYGDWTNEHFPTTERPAENGVDELMNLVTGQPLGTPAPVRDTFPAHLPLNHFPTNHPQDDYLYRNIRYQLDKHEVRNPQTGEVYDDNWDMRNEFPPIQRSPHYPGQRRDYRPIPEQTGPAEIPLGNGRTEYLPYMRGDQPAEPSSGRYYRDDQPLFGMGEGRAVEPSTQGENQYPEESVFRAQSPHHLYHGPAAREYFTPGMENTRMHQRSFPQLDRQYGDHFRTDPEMFGEGEQQGELFPIRWYLDHSKNYTAQTDLPPHLFPPNRFTIVDRPHPGQLSMWDRDYPTGNIDRPALIGDQSNINTHTEPLDNQQTPGLSENWYQHQDRPFGQWRAKKQAGPWTDHENSQFDRSDSEGDNAVGGEMHEGGKIIVDSKEEYFHLGDNFGWRIPVIYQQDTDQLFVGQPGMEHSELARDLGLPGPWNESNDPAHNTTPGYIDLEGATGQAGLKFYGNSIPKSMDLFSDWVENQYGVRADDPNGLPQAEPDDDLWQSSYHPRDNDEWVAGDEKDFSATIPHHRWR